VKIETMEHKKIEASVFYKDESGHIFHTGSTYGRGRDQFLGIYGYLDVMRKGPNENSAYHSLVDRGTRRGRLEWSKRTDAITGRPAATAHH
jgi:predicted dithiol-disulfide oxidoreductase (DUF899 family)